VQIASDVGNLRIRQVKLGHSQISTPVLDHRRDQFALIIVHHELRTDQIDAAVAAARIHSVAKCAVLAPQRLTACDCVRICLCVNWIGTAATTGGCTRATAASACRSTATCGWSLLLFGRPRGRCWCLRRSLSCCHRENCDR